MLTVVRDLFRYNREFAIGAILAVLVLGMAAPSFVSPYAPTRIYVVPPDVPPSWAHFFGTNSRGQDVFWQLTFALRNTLVFGFSVAVLSRIISLAVGLIAGYRGGMTDRVLMSINDTFIVIPLFPLLVLFYFVMRHGGRHDADPVSGRFRLDLGEVRWGGPPFSHVNPV
jgi:peptide/nickel transport system permease protein